MDRDQLADLLNRWALWVAGGNRAALGYAMVGYAERVGSSFSTDTSPTPVDPMILRLDECVRKLPPDHCVVVVAHYTRPGTAKAKRAQLDMSRDRYYELLDHARVFLSHMLDDIIVSRQSVET